MSPLLTAADEAPVDVTMRPVSDGLRLVRVPEVCPNDVAEAGAKKPLLGEEIERGIQDGLAGALSVGISRAGHKNLWSFI
ncbi:MAG TPA: hypothetical protein VMO26_19440 [Vicinamibacterales bacterium]|nr:hypothetical protein [Vicinamibacterales bacterium]